MENGLEGSTETTPTLLSSARYSFMSLAMTLLFPTPWRPREADRHGIAGLRVDLCDYLGRLWVLALYLGDHPRQRPPIAEEKPLDQAAPPPPLAHSVSSRGGCVSVWKTTQYCSVFF